MARLDSICKLNMGQSPDSASYNEDGRGVPFFQGNADFGAIHPSVRVWCDAPTKIAHAGDILISVRAPIGALNIANRDCCIGRGLAALTVNESVCNKKYLWHCISSKVDELNAKGTGSTFKAISKNVLAETEIALPNIEQQVKIANELELISNILSHRKQQFAKLDELVKSRFIEMFGDSEHNTMNWPTAKLSTLCDVGSSKRIYQSELTDNGIPFLRISDLNERIDGEYNEPQLFIPNERFDELKTNGLVPSAGDILVTARGTLGRCYIVKAEDKFYFQDGMISWLSDISENITSLYISELFATTGVQKQIANLQAGSTVAYLSIAMLKKLDIMMPPKALQQQFATFVEQVDKSKLEIQKSLEKLETLKKALMQKYFG